MSDKQQGYEEHQRIDVEGFSISDATATGLRPHDDLIWVGYGGMGGRWLTPDEALQVASAIVSVAHSNLERRGLAIPAYGGDA